MSAAVPLLPIKVALAAQGPLQTLRALAPNLHSRAADPESSPPKYLASEAQVGPSLAEAHSRDEEPAHNQEQRHPETPSDISQRFHSLHESQAIQGIQ